MGCDDEQCLPPNDAEFSFNLNGSPNTKPLSEVANPVSQDAAGTGQGLWLFLMISLVAGFASILTPCVFPMIPMTVSFFMRGNENRGKAIRTGLFFGLSIVFIFTLLGALFSFGVFGPNVGNILSTHWIPNGLFFILFVVFAFSFFGAFEMILPSSLVNKTDAKADKGGLIGAFFMALTTVIVSFSCTGPFIACIDYPGSAGWGITANVWHVLLWSGLCNPFYPFGYFPFSIK